MTTPASYELEQGPRWLADLLYAPPEWLPAALVAALLLGGVGVAWLATRADIDAQALSEIATNVTVLVVTWQATAWFVGHAGWPYLLDVAAGATLGVAAGYGVAGPLAKRLLAHTSYPPQNDDREASNQ